MSRFHNVFCLTEKKQLEIVFLQGKQILLFELFGIDVFHAKLAYVDFSSKSGQFSNTKTSIE